MFIKPRLVLLLFGALLIAVDAFGWNGQSEVIRIEPHQPRWIHKLTQHRPVFGQHRPIGQWGQGNRRRFIETTITNGRINCTAPGSNEAFRHEERCDRYYQCLGQRAVLRHCPHGTWFDVDFKLCLKKKDANCVILSPQSPSTAGTTSRPPVTTTSQTTTTRAPSLAP